MVYAEYRPADAPPPGVLGPSKAPPSPHAGERTGTVRKIPSTAHHRPRFPAITGTKAKPVPQIEAESCGVSLTVEGCGVVWRA